MDPVEPVESPVFDQTPIRSYSTMPTEPKSGSKKKWLVILVIAIAISAIFYFRFTNTSSDVPNPTATPTTAIIEPTTEVATSPTEAPEPTVAEKKISTGPAIQVQNGSGAEGVAGKMQTVLQDAGYDSVETGNADNFDYTGATIKAKDSSMATAEKIKTQLTDYTFGAEITTLSEDSDYDIIIIVGK